MDQHLFELALLRATERLIAVLLGGVAIVLGYRLFMNVPQSTESSAEADISGKVKIILTRIGPGVFFALFGAGIVWASYHYQVTTAAGQDMQTMMADTLKPDDTLRRTTQYVSYNGLGTATGDLINYEEQAGAVRRTLRVLNQLPAIVPVNRQPQNFVAAVRASKLSVIRSIWQTDKWGDYAGFDAWVDRGARPPVPKSFEEPYELFQLQDE